MASQNPREDRGPTVSVTEARQAQRGKGVIWVLGISMALVVAGFAALYFYHLPHLSQPGAQTAVNSNATAAGFQAPPPQPRQSENPQTSPTITPGQPGS